MASSMITGPATRVIQSKKSLSFLLSSSSSLYDHHSRALSGLVKHDDVNTTAFTKKKKKSLQNIHHQYNSHNQHSSLSSLPSFSTFTTPIITDDDTNNKNNSNDKKSNSNNNNEKSLTAKVDTLVSTPSGHILPQDLRFKCLDLLTDCCRLQTSSGLHLAEELLRRMIKEVHHVNDIDGGHPKSGQVYLGDRPFHTVMFGWAKLCSNGKDGGDGRGADKIKEWIKVMEGEYDYEVLTRKKFARKKVLKAIGIQEEEDDDDDDDFASQYKDYEGIAKEQENDEEKRKRERLSCRPTIQTHNILLHSLAETAKFMAAANSGQGKRRNDNRQRKGESGGDFSSSSTSALDIAKRAESALETIATLHTNSNNDNNSTDADTEQQEQHYIIKPNTKSYTYVLSAYANAHDPSSGTNAKRILDMMKRIHEMERAEYEETYGIPYNYSNLKENKQQIVTPDVIAYSMVIKAFANSAARGSAEKAEEILLDLIQFSGVGTTGEEYGGGKLGPDAIAFESTIRAWAKAASERKSPHARYEAAERAEAILELMKEAAYAAEADARQKERMILENATDAAKNKEDEDDGWGLDTKGGTLQDVLQEKIDEDDKEAMTNKQINRLRPTLATYNAVLHAWARSDTRESAPRAEALLRRMIDPYAFSSSPDDDDGADLSSIGPVVRPDAMSFHIVMNAWARFGRYDPTSAQRAEELLDLMYDMYTSGDYGEEIKPNAYSYTTVINAWARSEDNTAAVFAKDGETLSELSSEGDDTTEETKKGDVGPIVHKVAHARRLLDTLISKYRDGEKGMRPSVIPYTSVLNAAAHCSPKISSSDAATVGTEVEEEGAAEDPYNIAFHTYMELIRDSDGFGLRADHLAFVAMLQVVGKHTKKDSENRRIDVERVFDDACDAGQVSALVVRELQAVCPSVDLLQRLLGSEKFAREGMRSVDELPRAWTRNVKGDPRLRRLDNQGAKRNRGSRGRRDNRRGRKNDERIGNDKLDN